MASPAEKVDLKSQVEELIYMKGRRFTQDSPILRDVWQQYADLATDDPARRHDRVDLLLTPHRDSTPRELCMRIRERSNLASERKRRHERDKRFTSRGDFELFFNDSHVVVRLSFEEVLRIAMPLTKWWTRYVWKRPAVTEDADKREWNSQQWCEWRLRWLKEPKNRQRLADVLALIRAGRRDLGIQASEDLIWLICIIGTIAEPIVRPDGRKYRKRERRLVESFYRLIEGLDQSAFPASPTLWQVSLNRDVSNSISQSVRASKADASQRLFDLRCSTLTWAVIDSGIDARHPAFRKRITAEDAEDPSMIGTLISDRAFEVFGTNLINHTRIERSYNFTRLRKLLHVAIAEEDEGGILKELAKELDADEFAMVKDLRQGLRKGRFIDWDLLEPILRIDRLPDVAPDDGDEITHEHRVPADEHGTHVAGILAADWRRADRAGRGGDDEIADELRPWADAEYPDAVAPKSLFQGVCPDLNLYDLQVLDENGGDEFAVLAALQFVRHLNSGKDNPLIHGVNLSLSIRHDVANFACGRTPVCDECERVVGSGVVVVAAAGNSGYARVLSDKGPIETYRDISITDPGNAEGVITVGATHRFKPHTYGVSYFSSRGPTGDGRSKPDLVAPGEKIEAPVPGGKTRTLDGTSMAAPHVSGAAALLMARHSELKGQPARIKRILCESATDLGRERDFQGHGMLDVLRAIQSV